MPLNCTLHMVKVLNFMLCIFGHNLRKNKIHRNYLTKEAQDLHIKHFETLLKQTKEDLNKQYGIPLSWIGRLNIVKMSK